MKQGMDDDQSKGCKKLYRLKEVKIYGNIS